MATAPPLQPVPRPRSPTTTTPSQSPIAPSPSTSLTPPQTTTTTTPPPSTAMEDLVSFTPSTFHFNIRLNQQSHTTLTLHNITSSPLAFKVKTTNVHRYSVRPYADVLPPRAHIVVHFTQKAFSHLPVDIHHCRDRFQLLVAPLHGILDPQPPHAPLSLDDMSPRAIVATFGEVAKVWAAVPAEQVRKRKLDVTLAVGQEASSPPAPALQKGDDVTSPLRDAVRAAVPTSEEAAAVAAGDGETSGVRGEGIGEGVRAAVTAAVGAFGAGGGGGGGGGMEGERASMTATASTGGGLFQRGEVGGMLAALRAVGGGGELHSASEAATASAGGSEGSADGAETRATGVADVAEVETGEGGVNVLRGDGNGEREDDGLGTDGGSMGVGNVRASGENDVNVPLTGGVARVAGAVSGAVVRVRGAVPGWGRRVSGGDGNGAETVQEVGEKGLSARKVDEGGVHDAIVATDEASRVSRDVQVHEQTARNLSDAFKDSIIDKTQSLSAAVHSAATSAVSASASTAVDTSPADAAASASTTVSGDVAPSTTPLLQERTARMLQGVVTTGSAAASSVAGNGAHGVDAVVGGVRGVVQKGVAVGAAMHDGVRKAVADLGTAGGESGGVEGVADVGDGNNGNAKASTSVDPSPWPQQGNVQASANATTASKREMPTSPTAGSSTTQAAPQQMTEVPSSTATEKAAASVAAKEETKEDEIDYSSREYIRQRVVTMNTSHTTVIPDTGRDTRQRIAGERAGELARVIEAKMKQIEAFNKQLVEARHRLSDARMATRPAYDVRYEVSERAPVPFAQICIMAIISGALLQLLV